MPVGVRHSKDTEGAGLELIFLDKLKGSEGTSDFKAWGTLDTYPHAILLVTYSLGTHSRIHDNDVCICDRLPIVPRCPHPWMPGTPPDYRGRSLS